MPSRVVLVGATLVAALAFARTGRPQSPDDAAAHAKRVFELLGQGKVDEVASDFNASVAAALTPAQLGIAWTALERQAGAFKSFTDQKVTTPAPGITAVVLGCEFENTKADFVISFDRENKIAGLRIVPKASAPAQPAMPPASSHFHEETVTVGADEWALPGTLSMPDGAMAGAIVLVHGSGPNDRDETIGPNKPFRDLAWGLAERGVAVLRYEKRTRQYPAKVVANKNLTVRDETMADAILAATLLRRHDRIDPKRVFLLGHSLGGMLAPRIAAEDHLLAGLIIMAGSTRPILDSAREQLAYLASLKPGGVNTEEVLESIAHAVPESYWKDLDTYKPADIAAQLTIPMLILQGERDYQVTLQDLNGWREALDGHRNVVIKSYPTLNHLFLPGEGKSTPAEYERLGHIPDFVLDDIANWIQTH